MARPRLKYEPLRRHLAGLPAATTQITLTVPEIAAIIGAPLPASAQLPPFWANMASLWGASSQARAWRGAGWRVVSLTPGRPPAVTFVRADAIDRPTAPSG